VGEVERGRGVVAGGREGGNVGREGRREGRRSRSVKEYEWEVRGGYGCSNDGLEETKI